MAGDGDGRAGVTGTARKKQGPALWTDIGRDALNTGGQKMELGQHLRRMSELQTSEPWEERSVSGWPGGDEHPSAPLSQSGLGRKKGTSTSGVRGGPG